MVLVVLVQCAGGTAEEILTFRVIMSSLPAHFRHLDMFPRFMPATLSLKSAHNFLQPYTVGDKKNVNPWIFIERHSPMLMFLSHRKCAKPSDRSVIWTRATWEVSIACRLRA